MDLDGRPQRGRQRMLEHTVRSAFRRRPTFRAARYYAATWTDASGNLWLFGGDWSLIPRVTKVDR